MLAEHTHIQNHSRRHFCAWKTQTKRFVEGRRNKSDALYRVSCLRMVWARWNRAVGWRRRITAMECRRLGHLHVTTLRRWCTYTRNRIKIKALTTKAIAFQKTKLRLKVWRLWLRYIVYRQDQQKQLAWVLSYYSVEILLRRSLASVFKQSQKGDTFTCWKSYWQERQVINEKQLQARVFHCVHVEQSVLATWGAFVRARKQTKVAKAFNSTKVVLGSFRFWKRRVHVVRQMRKMLLYQESFRAQTHFDAWKRFMLARKQMNERLHKAICFKDKLRKLDVWQKWSVWVSIQHQERATIALAVSFRERFFTRKTFVLWKGRAANWKHKRFQSNRALLQFKNALLHRGFRLLVDWWQFKVKVAQLQVRLSTVLVRRRKCRVITNMRDLCAESNRKRALIKRACSHWQICHQQKVWGRIMQWFDASKYRKLQHVHADNFARIHLLRRCVQALQVHIYDTKQVKAKIEAFRCRYFRSVADDCFFQWRSFTTFKLKLHILRRQSLQSQRRQRLQQWHRIAVEKVRRRVGMQQLAVKRRRHDLLKWFSHWESVCTDQWIDKELIAHHQRHAQKQRMLRFAVKTLKSRLPARFERQKCRRFFLQHHCTFLIQVLHQWRQTTSTCDV
ncbi:hypothetical protein PHPALM_28145 [Phytophthora palmivora]|uniref:Uncharacterized protein n=1 Tax=Phytophthora palmivora TaxID=4796 RepID=A0A2P4XAS8_9STRA|nr:hypothetical protein PHPALM_28145 [Phytophthora palmivora]